MSQAQQWLPHSALATVVHWGLAASLGEGNDGFQRLLVQKQGVGLLICLVVVDFLLNHHLGNAYEINSVLH